MNARFQTKVTEIQKLDRRSRRADQELASKDDLITQLRESISQAQQTISEQTQAISQQSAALTQQSSVLSQQSALIQQQASAMTALQNRLTVEEQATNADAIRLGAIEASYLKRFMLPDWTVVIAQNLVGALLAGNRTYSLTLAAALGVKAGDNIFAAPKGVVPGGLLVGLASAPANNTLNIQIANPLINIGGSMSVVLALYTLRP